MSGADSAAVPLVSIIMPSFHHAAFLCTAIESVLAQDHPSIEFIVVDGGSTDGTVEILKEYGDRIAWISEPDRGQADAVNKGFSRARGKYLGWLNSDDVYAPGAVRAAVEYLETHPEVALVYGDAEMIGAAGEKTGMYATFPFDAERLKEFCYICQPTVFFRAEVFQEVGPLDVSLHYCMDYEYWLRIARAHAFGYLPRTQAAWRLHGATKSERGRAAAHREAIAMLRRYSDHIPFSWFYGLAGVEASRLFRRGLEGVHSDRWAESRIAFPGGGAKRMRIEGEAPTENLPLTLSVEADGVVVDRIRIEERRFTHTIPLPSAASLALFADRWSTAGEGRAAGDHRMLSYRLRRITLEDDAGKWNVVAPFRSLLYRCALPILYGAMYAKENRRLPW